MAYIRLNSKNLNMDVLVGISESYEPSDEILAVANRTEKLKKKTSNFLKKNWKNTDVQEIFKIFKDSPEEKKKWDKYMEEKYIPELNKIVKLVGDINNRLQEVP